MKKEHLLFKNPQEGVTDFKQKSRYNPNSTENEEEMEDIVKDYTPKKEDFERSCNPDGTVKERAETTTISIKNTDESVTVPTPANKDMYHATEMRLDYMFVTDGLARSLRSVQVPKNLLTDVISDHCPLVVDFE